LPAALINLPQYKTVNLHPSLLPKYRGPAPIQAALLNNDKTTGATLMLIDEQMDHGPIISQQSININPKDNYLILSKKLAALSSKLLIKTIPNYVSGKVKPQPQDHSQATFTKIIKKTDGLITAHKSAQLIYNMWRAYTPWPGIYLKAKVKNKDLRINFIDIKLTDLRHTRKSPILFSQNKQLYLACAKQTTLHINSLQPQGKNKMDAQSFINGYLK